MGRKATVNTRTRRSGSVVIRTHGERLDNYLLEAVREANNHNPARPQGLLVKKFRRVVEKMIL